MPTLKSLVDETTNIKNEIVECRDTLRQILIDKKIQDLENENKLSILIDKVKMLIDAPSVLYLYKDGDSYTNITGGYTINNDTASTGSDCNLTFSSDRIISNNFISNKQCRSSCVTNYPIDLTNYKKLIFKMAVTSAWGDDYANRAMTGFIAEKKDGDSVASVKTSSANDFRDYIIDISNIVGARFVGFDAYMCNGYCTEIRLEGYQIKYPF